MATYDLEEQERIAALKDWWEKWRVWVIICSVAFLSGVFGTHAYRAYQAKQSVEAETLMKSVQQAASEATASKDPKKLSEAAKVLADKYPRTFYATDAQLLAAKAAFDANDFASTKSHLQWVVDNGRATYQPIARLRLASVLLDEKKYDEALKILDGVNDEAHVSNVADLRGDILFASGKKDEARAAYQLGVEKVSERSPIKQQLQAKLDAVGGSTKPEAKADTKGATK